MYHGGSGRLPGRDTGGGGGGAVGGAVGPEEDAADSVAGAPSAGSAAVGPSLPVPDVPGHLWKETHPSSIIPSSSHRLIPLSSSLHHPCSSKLVTPSTILIPHISSLLYSTTSSLCHSLLTLYPTLTLQHLLHLTSRAWVSVHVHNVQCSQALRIYHGHIRTTLQSTKQCILHHTY